VEHLGEPEAALVLDARAVLAFLDEPRFVEHQYSGATGRIENCQIGVFLAYTNRRGHAFIDRELRLPKQWTQEAKRRREAHVPDEVAFRTKPQKRLTPNSLAKTRCESTRRACAARSFWRKSKKYDFMALGTPSVSAGSTHVIENRCSDCEIRIAA
jgi:hypothetical protein